MYAKKIFSADWFSEAGYEPIVHSSSEREQNDIKGIQKFQFLLKMFPQNQVLRKIAQKRSLEIVDITPDELAKVMEEEDQIQRLAQQQQIQQPTESAAQPTDNQFMQGIQEKLGELAQLNAG